MTTIYRPMSRNYSFCRDSNLIHTKERGSMLNKQIKLVKAARVKKQIEPFTSS